MPYQNAAEKPNDINEVKDLIPLDEMINNKYEKARSKFKKLEEFYDFKVLGYYHKIGTCMASKKFYRDAKMIMYYFKSVAKILTIMSLIPKINLMKENLLKTLMRLFLRLKI